MFFGAEKGKKEEATISWLGMASSLGAEWGERVCPIFCGEIREETFLKKSVERGRERIPLRRLPFS